MGELVVGIDVGTTKICTLVGEVRAEDIFVVGVGVEPARGMKKGVVNDADRSEEHTSELQSRGHLVCRLLLEKKNNSRRWTARPSQCLPALHLPSSAW